MALEISRDYRLRWFDFDCHGHLQATTALDLFQDIATLHAEDMGIGYETMQARGCFWVVVRIRYEILEQPTWGQAVTVRTWPHSKAKYSFMRDFTLADANGRQLVKATSEWMPIDIATRKFVRVSDIYDGPVDFVDERAFATKPKKIIAPEKVAAPYLVVPAFTDVDVNGHVNNTRYPKFVLDALDPQPDQAIRTLQIDYRHEVLPGTPLAIHCQSRENGAIAQGIRKDGETAFNCAIEWMRGC